MSHLDLEDWTRKFLLKKTQIFISDKKIIQFNSIFFRERTSSFKTLKNTILQV